MRPRRRRPTLSAPGPPGLGDPAPGGTPGRLGLGDLAAAGEPGSPQLDPACTESTAPSLSRAEATADLGRRARSESELLEKGVSSFGRVLKFESGCSGRICSGAPGKGTW